MINGAGLIGIPHDQFRLVISLLLAIPLGFFHQLLPNATVKHIYSAAIGEEGTGESINNRDEHGIMSWIESMWIMDILT